MSQIIIKGIAELINEAKEISKIITFEDAKKNLNNEGFVYIDIRDYREIVREGKIPGAFSCPRGMLEFWIDPKSPYHKNIFNQNKTYIFYCASDWRSALAVKTATEMGLKPVFHIEGGFNYWVKQGGKVEIISNKKKV